MENVRKLLSSYDKQKVDVYIAYLGQLKTEKNKDGNLKNYWFQQISPVEFADVFKKVFDTGLSIDGDSVSLSYRKKLVIVYDYHAYKNKIMLSYPDTKFDFQIVYEGDEFSFKKESGKVIYSHTMSNPFKTNKKIIGAYGIIKNVRGEFVELLTMDDINKMRNTSLMKNIWDAWMDRMVLKSVIKRICKIHFNDITQTIDSIDNESGDPELALISDSLQKKISEADSYSKLTEIYNQHIEDIGNKEAFKSLLGERKNVIKSLEKQLSNMLSSLEESKKESYIEKINSAKDSYLDTIQFYETLINELS